MKTLILFLFTAGRLLGSQYTMEEKAFAIGTDLEISGYGTIEEKVLSIGRRFIISGKLSGSSSENVFKLGTVYRVMDDRGKVLAIVSKLVVRSALTIGNVFSIQNEQGEEIAISEKIWDVYRPTIVIKESNGAISTLKSSGAVYYTWDINQSASSKLDPRVLWVIAASKTAKDNDSRY